MNFFLWKKKRLLLVNKFGILEPQKTRKSVPNLMLLPILAFDRNKYRLGYGKGFYDRYLNKYLKKFNCSILVNTSFNISKDPTVFDLFDVYVNMKRMNIKFVLMDDGFYETKDL